MADILNIRPAADTKWDCVSFGEVMLRFDPGFGRVRMTLALVKRIRGQ